MLFRSLLFLSGCQLCSKCFYTLPRAIKEKKKNEEVFGFSHVAGGREKGDNFSLFFDCGEKQKVGFLDSRGEEKKIRFLVFAKIGEKRLAV